MALEFTTPTPVISSQANPCNCGYCCYISEVEDALEEAGSFHELESTYKGKPSFTCQRVKRQNAHAESVLSL